MADTQNDTQHDSGTEHEDVEPTPAGLTPDDVAAWLDAHPDFLVDHPALAERLTLPDGDGAVSLTEFRSRRLIDENEKLRRQLGELGTIAGENERLMRRLHDLTLALAATDSAAALFDELACRLRDDFQADTLRVRLHDAADIAAEGVLIESWSSASDSGMPDWLRAVLDDGRPECGRLTQAKREWLFGDEAEAVGSAALVPIPIGGAASTDDVGLLAIGARADDRFQPGLGTLFLELLGATLANRLQTLATDGERRRRA